MASVFRCACSARSCWDFRDNAAPARVSIGLPQLLSLEAFNVASLTLANLTGSTLDLRLTAVRQATLRDNHIDDLRITAMGVRTLDLDMESFAGSSLHIQGDTNVASIE